MFMTRGHRSLKSCYDFAVKMSVSFNHSLFYILAVFSRSLVFFGLRCVSSGSQAPACGCFGGS